MLTPLKVSWAVAPAALTRTPPPSPVAAVLLAIDPPVVVLDEPQGTVFGGDVAAPAFAKIMQYALTVERVPASTPTSAATTGPIP